MPPPPASAADLLICTACGTQFPTADRSALLTCRICLDPRQFVPPSGQRFTTLRSMTSGDAPAYRNSFVPLAAHTSFVSIVTEPKFAIGQRAILIRTPAGNVLWDCVALLDTDTIATIERYGGLAAIVISHPHYYTTHLEWSKAFQCPVYLAEADEQWVSRRDASAQQFVCAGDVTSFEVAVEGQPSGVKVYRLGGHFDGSLVALYNGHLLIADTLVTTPAGLGDYRVDRSGDAEGASRDPHKRAPPADDMASFSFMWSIPNMIPMSANTIMQMWRVLREVDFNATHGAFLGMEIEDEGVKVRVLRSMQIQVRSMGWETHSLLSEGLH